MAGNVQELTEDLIGRQKVGELSPGSEERSLLVYVRGRSYLSETPLKWDDMLNPPNVPDATEYNITDPTIGFRVVLDTTR